MPGAHDITDMSSHGCGHKTQGKHRMIAESLPKASFPPFSNAPPKRTGRATGFGSDRSKADIFAWRCNAGWSGHLLDPMGAATDRCKVLETLAACSTARRCAVGDKDILNNNCYGL